MAAGPCGAKASSYRSGQSQWRAQHSKSYFFFVGVCSANTSTHCFPLKSRMKRGSLGTSSITTQRSRSTVYSPEFAGNTQVLAASHQGVTLAAFSRCRHAGGVEIFLLSSGNGHEPSWLDEHAGFPTRIGETYRPWQTNAYSRLTIFGPTLVSLLGASPHPPGPNALLSIRLYLISGRYKSPSIQRSAPVHGGFRTCQCARTRFNLNVFRDDGRHEKLGRLR
jgi:hypothetical protein